ncbi:MAG: ATPase [Candidatus Bathyarchaeia archaeon]
MKFEVESLFFEDVKVSRGNAPRFTLDGSEIDLWSDPYVKYHSRTPVDYITEKIIEEEREGRDPFPDIVGKEEEKELVKNALLSGSPILFKGRRGYGKTTFSKAIAKLLPEKQLAVKGCKIYDDPLHPTCFSCKKKVLEDKVVELSWIPRVWIRIPGDPMLTSRQLIGGISIQKIREGYDLDHPEVFIPGRALKANRGVGYFDELGAVPSSLQTLLHELFEEQQVTTMEGDVLPFKIQTLELASTNPANYRGTNPIKEPLLDRMEEIVIGPPATLEEEIEIGKRNMYISKVLKKDPRIPSWHLKILARAVRYGRSGESRCPLAKNIESEPSCRATIKLYDHVKSRALRSGRESPLLSDYGESYQIVRLALAGRIEVEAGATVSKTEIIRCLVNEAIKETCKEIYDKIPSDRFVELYEELRMAGVELNGRRYLPIDQTTVSRLKGNETVDSAVRQIAEREELDEDLYLSALEILLHSIALCLPRLVERKERGYLMRGMEKFET